MALNARDLERQLEIDLDWRHAELAIFREMITPASISSVRQSVLFRAAWAILYAHYEGFCKNALQLFADYLTGLPNCHNIPHGMFLFLHDKAIREAKVSSSADAYIFFRQTLDELKLVPPPSLAVDTKCNLWPDLLKELLDSFDISPTKIIEKPERIKTLVARRNDIAHGQKVFISDLAYYLEYENIVRNLMYALALAIIEKIDDL